MKTEISILFKKPFQSTLLFRNEIEVYVDSEKSSPIKIYSPRFHFQTTKQNIELTPGPHCLIFKYEVDKLAKFSQKLTFGAIGAGFGLGTGSFTNATIGANITSDIGSKALGYHKTQDNYLECNLKEGDTLNIELKPKANGKVKVKVLK